VIALAFDFTSGDEPSLGALNAVTAVPVTGWRIVDGGRLCRAATVHDLEGSRWHSA
jgi:hypothetical protein